MWVRIPPGSPLKRYNMKKYHLIKSTRVYDGYPYCGISSNNIPAETDTYDDAVKLQKKLLDNNPVGWYIIDSSTGKKVP